MSFSNNAQRHRQTDTRHNHANRRQNDWLKTNVVVVLGQVSLVQ